MSSTSTTTPSTHSDRIATPNDQLSIQKAVDLGFGGYSTLRKLIAAGDLPARKVGSRIKLRLEDLESLAVPVSGRPAEQQTIDTAIARLVAAAPRLSNAQREKLAVILGGGS